MMDNQKNTKVMKIVLMITKVAITTVAALIDPWLVIPTLIALELTTLKIANQTSPKVVIKEKELPISNKETVTEERTKDPNPKIGRTPLVKGGNKTKNVNIPKSPQTKSSKPRTKREVKN